MGKRSHRISPEELESWAPKLINQPVQLVKWDQSTHSGTFLGAENQSVSLQDHNAKWYNKQKHTHQISYQTIREIIFDEVSSW